MIATICCGDRHAAPSRASTGSFLYASKPPAASAALTALTTAAASSSDSPSSAAPARLSRRCAPGLRVWGASSAASAPRSAASCAAPCGVKRASVTTWLNMKRLSATAAARHTSRNDGASRYVLHGGERGSAWQCVARSGGVLFRDKERSPPEFDGQFCCSGVHRCWTIRLTGSNMLFRKRGAGGTCCAAWAARRCIATLATFTRRTRAARGRARACGGREMRTRERWRLSMWQASSTRWRFQPATRGDRGRPGDSAPTLVFEWLQGSLSRAGGRIWALALMQGSRDAARFFLHCYGDATPQVAFDCGRCRHSCGQAYLMTARRRSSAASGGTSGATGAQ
eukprot:355390-Chlamydomonas_euryale.AAC.2